MSKKLSKNVSENRVPETEGKEESKPTPNAKYIGEQSWAKQKTPRASLFISASTTINNGLKAKVYDFMLAFLQLTLNSNALLGFWVYDTPASSSKQTFARQTIMQSATRHKKKINE